jgi:hypothetical protein
MQERTIKAWMQEDQTDDEVTMTMTTTTKWKTIASRVVGSNQEKCWDWAWQHKQQNRQYCKEVVFEPSKLDKEQCLVSVWINRVYVCVYVKCLGWYDIYIYIYRSIYTIVLTDTKIARLSVPLEKSDLFSDRHVRPRHHLIPDDSGHLWIPIRVQPRVCAERDPSQVQCLQSFFALLLAPVVANPKTNLDQKRIQQPAPNP